MFRSTSVSLAWYRSHQNKPLTNPMRRWVPLKMTVVGFGLIFGSIPASYFYYGSQVTDGPGAITGKCQQANMITLMMVEMLPWNYMSRYCGGFASQETLPHWVHQWMICAMVWIYDVRTTVNADRSGEPGDKKQGINLLKDPEELKKLKRFSTLQHFFTRERDVAPDIDTSCALVAPCDARLLQVDECKARDGYSGRGLEKLIQTKGVYYSLTNLLRTSDVPAPPVGHTRYFWTFYLEPGTYHRFHCPAEKMAVDFTVHVPGHLLPISPKSTKWLPNLYVGNERVNVIGTYATSGSSSTLKPLIAMSMVGAAKVGCIEVDIDQRIQTNPDLGFGDFSLKRDYNIHTPVLQKGAELGRFKLGSSIVLVADVPDDAGPPSHKVGDVVQVGEALLGVGALRT